MGHLALHWVILTILYLQLHMLSSDTDSEPVRAQMPCSCTTSYLTAALCPDAHADAAQARRYEGCPAEVYIQSNVTAFFPTRAALNGVNCSILLRNNLTGAQAT